MQIERKRPTAKGPSEWFTGDVYIDPVLGRKDEPSRMACGWVHFTPGARTAWHSHAVGQTLLITEGIALLGTRNGEVIVARPGQVVYTPPGEEHWHGAAPENFMAHIARSTQVNFSTSTSAYRRPQRATGPWTSAAPSRPSCVPEPHTAWDTGGLSLRDLPL